MSDIQAIQTRLVDDIATASDLDALERSEQATQQAYLKAPRPEAGAGFGMTVALSDDGHTVAVGAPFETSAQGEGAVHVFRRTHGHWLAQARLLPAPGGEARLFGTVMSTLMRTRPF